MKKEIKNRNTFVIAAFLIVAVLAVPTFIKYYNKNTVVIDHLNFLENFEPNAQLSLRYKKDDQNNITEINQKLDDQGSVKINENFDINGNDNYQVSYEISNETKNKTSFQVQVGGNMIQSRLKGLPLKSSVFVTLDKNIIEKKVPVDWSGAISFKHTIQKDDKDVKKLCFIVTHSKVSTLCHTIPAMRGQLS